MQSPFLDLLPGQADATKQSSGPYYFGELELNSPFVPETIDYSGESINDNEEAPVSGYPSSETNTWSEQESDIAYIEGEVNYEKAVRSNATLASQLGWSFFELEIYQLLGFDLTSPSPEEFADAVARWQAGNDLPSRDGIVGQNTWTAMLKAIINKTSFAKVSIRTAIPANEKLRNLLGWQKYEIPVYKVLGFFNETPGPEIFAKAVALWQPKWGFTGTAVDGRLGEKTWARIRSLVLAQVADEQQVFEKTISYPAVIKGTPGIYLHKAPKVSDQQRDILYPYGEKVSVIAESTIAAEKDWVKIMTKDKRVGWIQSWHLANISLADILNDVTIPPHYYQVQEGDGLDKIVKNFYRDYPVAIGNDRRTIIHAISILNTDSDAIYYEGHTSTWLRDNILDRSMEETRTIYNTIKLRKGKIIYLPTRAYVEYLRDKGLVGVRPDWKNIAIVAGKSIAGFLAGLAEGFVDGAIDLVKGLWDLIKNIVTGKLFSDIYDIYKQFEKYTLGDALSKIWVLIKAIVGEKVDAIKKDFDHPDPYYKFHSIGKMVGYILFEVVLAFFTVGTSLAAKTATKFARIIELLAEATTLRRVAGAIESELPAIMKTWDRIDDLNNYVGAGTAIFKAFDSIAEMNFEGVDFSITKVQQEQESGFEYDYDDSVTAPPVPLGNSTGDEAERKTIQALIDGHPTLQQQGIPKFDYVLRGQHNGSQNGIDLFGFTVSGDKVKIFIFEIKGGIQPSLPLRSAGIQFGFSWIEEAIDKALLNPELNKKLKDLFRHYHGRTFTNAEIKKMLLKAERTLVIAEKASKYALNALVKVLKRRELRKVGTIVFETGPEDKEIDDYVQEEDPLFAGDESTDLFPAFENQVGKPVLVRRLSAKRAYLVFDNATNAAITGSNQQQVLKSGLAVADIETAMGRVVDLNDIRQLLMAHNAISPGDQYMIAAPGSGTVDAVFTEAVHQFQVASYADSKYQDGVVGPSSLDTMGFEDHGLRARINSSSLYGQGIVNGAVTISSKTGGKFNARNWFGYIMQPAWLGIKITGGIHALLHRELRKAQDWLLAQPAYAGMTPVELGKKLGVGYISGARLSAAKEAMHGLGLAIDIDGSRNPWIGAGWVQNDPVRLKERVLMIDLLEQIAGTVLLASPYNGCKISSGGKKTIFAYLDSIAKRHGTDTTLTYLELSQRNIEFVAHVNNPANSKDLRYWQQSYTFDKGKAAEGFLHLHADLVRSLRQVALLAWGAVDFGPCASGDIMHFDYRTIGVGRDLCKAMRGYVPDADHPSFNVAASSAEMEDFYSETIAGNENGHESHEAIEEDLLMEPGTDFYQEDEGYGINDNEGPGSSMTEMDEQVKSWLAAIAANRRYAVSLGWGQYYDAINTLLLPYSGYGNVSLGEEAFAQALSLWQAQQGLTADGILGPATLNNMRPLFGTGSSIPSTPFPVTPPSGSAPPSSANILQFNQYHAQKVLNAMNSGILGTRFNSKAQLEGIARGQVVKKVDPVNQQILVLPVMSHIADQATLNNYHDIIIGSFIRDPAANGNCSGHCAGNRVDINYQGGGFTTAGSVQMVVRILQWLQLMPAQNRHNLGFGMPLQGAFFGNQPLAKFHSVNPNLLGDPTLRQLVPQLGFVFPDNDNHLHIQLK